MVTYNAQHILQMKLDPQDMESIQDDCHTQARERLSYSEELQTNIRLMSDVHTIRMILNRIVSLVEQRIIKEQTSFRPGMSCTSQLLNLTQHIEDRYHRGMITGAAFVDISAAYDTVNHSILIQKLYNITKDSPLCRVIQNKLSSRRFYVELNNESSRRRKQNNGLPQGSVLFNIFT